MINMGIVGTGGRSINELASFIKRFPEKAEIVAIADINTARLKLANKHLGGKNALYSSIDKMLEHKELDAVIIGTPDATHKDIAIKCFESGKHVLCEKPLAISVKDCQAIETAARKAGKILQIGFCLRYAPVYQELHRLVSSGAIGIPKYIQIGDYYPGGKTYFRRWNRFEEMSGGLLVHKGSHAFDIANWLINSTPVSVAAFGGNEVFVKDHKKPKYCSECNIECPDRYSEAKDQLHRKSEDLDNHKRDLCLYNSEKTAFDNAVIIIEYANGSRVSYGECFFATAASRFFTIMGDKGEIRMREDKRCIWTYNRANEEKKRFVAEELNDGGHAGGGDYILVRDFLNSIESNDMRVLADAKAGTMAVAIGQAAEIAIREKRIVKISEL